jgi:hypothetical protein
MESSMHQSVLAGTIHMIDESEAMLKQTAPEMTPLFLQDSQGSPRNT